MSWPSGQCDKTRRQILESAAQLFALNGYAQVSIDDLMANAGLTRGAFYHHFRTKSEVYDEAIQYALEVGRERLNELSGAGLGALADGYLQRSHAAGESLRCPLAFMATDVTRSEKEIRQVYSTTLQSFVGRLESNFDASAVKSRQRALQMAVALIGGMVLARAVDDPAFSEEILEACRADCHELLGSK